MKKLKLNCTKWILAALLFLISGLALVLGCAPAAVEEKRTVTFMNGSEIFEVQEVDLGEKYEFPASTPVREQPDEDHMYEFLGWTLDPNFYEYRSEILTETDYVVGDITIYAAFRKVAIADTEGGGADLEYNVEFRMPVGEDFGDRSGEILSDFTQTVKRYQSAELPSAEDMPKIEGYTFTGKWEGGSLTDIRGHRRVTAVYQKNIYNCVWHYLGKTKTVEVEYKQQIDLTQTPDVDPAFVFENWYMDGDFTVPAVLTQAPAEDLHLYAKYGINFSTATISSEGDMVYGDEFNKLYVSGLNFYDGLEYRVEWTVNGSADASNGLLEYPLKNAGGYNVGVHIYADYLNGLITDEAYAKTESGSTDFSFELRKATLSAEVAISSGSVVYGSAAPTVSVEYSGFKFGETAESVGVGEDFKYMQGNTDFTGTNLHAGSYRIETLPHTLQNYEFAPIDALAFEVTKRDLTVNFSVSDYEYGTGLEPEITFSNDFVYGESSKNLGEHWFTLAPKTRSAVAGEKYTEGDILHAGNHVIALKGFESGDYQVHLPGEESFKVEKRKASATISALGGAYGTAPQITYKLENVLAEDEARFTPEYSYALNGSVYGEEYFVKGGYTVFGVGDYGVSAKFTENGAQDYEPLTVEGAQFSIVKKDIRVTALVDKSYEYGNAISPTVSYGEGFAFNENENTVGLVLGGISYKYRRAADGALWQSSGFVVDDYTVEAGGIYADNYNFVFDKTPFSVVKKELTLTVHLESDNILYGAMPAAAKANDYYNGVSYSGFAYNERVNNVFNTLPEIVYLQNGEEAESFHAGTYEATVFADPQNYKITVNTVTLTVRPRTLYVGISLNRNSLVYGNKPVATIGYVKEGYNGFYADEQGLYTSGAYVEYAGGATYTQAELGSAECKMAVGRYSLSVKGIANLKDYVITYGYEDTPVLFEITPQTLTVTASAEGFTYGDRELPAPALVYSGFVYGENEKVLIGEPVYSYARSGETYVSGYFDAGDYSVSVGGLSASNYTVVPVSGNFTVEKRSANISVGASGCEYGGEPEFSCQSNILPRDLGGFNIQYVSSIFSGGKYVEYLPQNYKYYQAGDYRLTVTYAQNVNYQTPTVSGASFTVTPKKLTVGVSGVNSVYVYGDAVQPKLTFSGFAEGENENTQNLFTEKPQTEFLYYTSGGNLTQAARFNADSYSVAPAAGYVAANYTVVYGDKTPFTVAPKPLTVTVSVKDITYGEAPAPTLGYSEFAYLETASVLSGSAQFLYDGRVSANGYYRAGKHNVEVSGLSSQNYAITFVGGSFTVDKKDLGISVAVQDFVYGGEPEPELSFSGFASGESLKDLDGEISLEYSGNLINGKYHAGSYGVAVGGCTSGDYNITFTGGTFTVTPKDLTFTLSVDNIKYGETPNPKLGYSGFIEGEDIVNLGGELVYGYTGERSESGFLRAGKHTLTVCGYTSADYAISYPQGVEFEVSPKTVTLTMNGGWNTYADDRAAEEGGYWYTCGGDEIYGGELTFSLSITRNGKEYIHGSNKYYPVGGYVVTVGRNINPDYVVTRGGSVVEAETSVSFDIAQKPVTITVNGGSKPWAERAAWAYTPTIDDARFNLSGVIVLNTQREIPAASYSENSIGETFTWQNGYSIQADGEVVTDNFAISYVLNLTLSNSSFSITVPENTEYTYNAAERSFPVTATADGISAGDITCEYSVNSIDDYSQKVPAFTNAGEYTVYYKVSAKNTDPESGSFTVKINKADIAVTAPNNIRATFNATDCFVGLTNVEGVKVGGAEDTYFTANKQISYGTTEQNCTQSALTVKNVTESCTVYYKVTAGENYNEAKGSYTITVTPAELTVEKPSDVETEYDTKDHFAEVGGVAGVAGDSEFGFTVTYGRSAAECTEKSLSVVNVKDGGKVYYKVTAGSNYNEVTGYYTITIFKATVTVPKIAGKVYTASVQTADIQSNGYYTVTSNAGGVAAGSYQVVLTLNDSDNYKWATGAEEAELSIDFIIDRADLSCVVSDISTTYNGANHFKAPNIQGLMGDDAQLIKIQYGSSQEGEYSFVEPEFINATAKEGQTVYFKAEAGANYNAVTGNFTITVNKAEYTVTAENQNYEYNAAAHGEPITVRGVDNAEVEGAIVTYNGNEAVAQYKDYVEGGYTVNYAVAETQNYNAAKGSYTIIIEQREIAVEMEIPAGSALSYNGENNINVLKEAISVSNYCNDNYRVKYRVEKISVEKVSALGLDGEWMNTVDELGEFINAAGDYRLYVKVGNSANAPYQNYKEEIKSFTFTVNKASLARPTEDNTQFTYNGEQKTYDPQGYDNSTMEIAGNKQINANVSGYPVTVSIKDVDNYEWATENNGSKQDKIEFTFKILKAEYAVTAENQQYVYNAAGQGRSLEELKALVSVYGSDEFEVEFTTASTAVDAGEITVNYKVYGNGNYNDYTGSYKITVTPAEISLTAPENITADYNAQNRFAGIGGVAGVPGDSSFDFTVTYGKSEEDCTQNSLTFVNVADSGKVYYKVTAGSNYKAATGSYTITINKAEYNVDGVSDITGVYNAAEHGRSPEELKSLISVYGSDEFEVEFTTASTAVNAGEVTVNYKIYGNGNYNDHTDSYTITIGKADPRLIDSGAASDTYSPAGGLLTEEAVRSAVNAVEEGCVYVDATVTCSISYQPFTGGDSTDLKDDFAQIKNAGTYKITVTVSGDNYNQKTVNYTFTVNRAALTRPTADNTQFTYTGNPQTYNPQGYDNSTMEIAGNEQVKANVSGYPVTVSIKDVINYEWATENNGSKQDSIEFTFIILKGVHKQLPSGVSLPEIGEQVNKLGKTLKDISLTSGFYWADDTTPLQPESYGYEAYYNSDPENYDNFNVTITFTTRKERVTITRSGNGIIESEINTDLNIDSLLTAFSFAGEEGRVLSAEELVYIAHAINGNYSKEIGSTYLVTITFSINSNNYFEFAADTATEFNGIIKVKSVSIGDGALYTIEDALNTAQSGQTITVKNNTSFAEKSVAAEAGYNGDNYYTVKSGVILLLPYDNDGNYSNREGTEATFADSSKENMDKNLVHTLSIVENVTLTVNGTLNIGGIVGHTGTGLSAHTSGKYSQILMFENTKIVLNDAIMNLYGYIKTPAADTQASIEANGSTKISAPFVVYDYRGGSNTVGSYKDGLNIGDLLKSMFSDEIKITDPTISPFSVYDMPNIQATLKITHSSTLIGLVDLYTSDPAQHNTADINVIASNDAVINLTGTSSYAITRYTPGSYDATRGGYTVNNFIDGKTKIEIHGDANLGSMTLTMRVNLPVLGDKKVNVSTAEVYFPVSWKYDIIIAEGTATVGTKVKFMTGSSVIVKEGSTFNIAADTIFYQEFTDTSTISPKYPSKSPAILKVDGTVIINAPFGGIITSETNGAKIVANKNSSVTSREGYGTKSGSGTSTTFTFNEVASITGVPQSKDANGDGSPKNLSANSVYIYHNNAWIAADAQFAINYNYVFKDAQGNPQTATLSPVNGNPAQHSYNDGIIELSPATCEGWTFIGWFTNEACEERYSIDKISDTMLEEITLYGLFQKVDAYVITYNLGYPNGYSLPEGKDAIVIGSETVLAKDISEYDPAKHNNAVQVYDYDPNVQYYFGGWYVDSGFTKLYSFENLKSVYGEAIGSTPVTLYAKWEKKLAITFSDTVESFNKGIYLMSGQTYSFTNADIGYNPINDHNIDVSTYFGGWQGCSYSEDKYSITASTAQTVVAERANKAKIVLKSGSSASSCNNQYSIKVDGIENVTRTKFNGDKIFYLKEGQSATVTGYCVGSLAGSVHDDATKELTINSFENGKQYTYTYTSTSQSSGWFNTTYSGSWSGPVDNGKW